MKRTVMSMALLAAFAMPALAAEQVVPKPNTTEALSTADAAVMSVNPAEAGKPVADRGRSPECIRKHTAYNMM